jgi:hypothetical protein
MLLGSQNSEELRFGAFDCRPANSGSECNLLTTIELILHIFVVLLEFSCELDYLPILSIVW